MVHGWVSHNITVKALPLALQYCEMYFYSVFTDYNPKFYVQ